MRTSVHVTRGRADGPVAAMLPGSGSTADFVTRAFGPALHAAGFTLVVADPRPGPGLLEAAFAALDRVATRYDLRLVGGVSLGAHVAARWAAGRVGSPTAPDGLVVALPAWTGPPGSIAAASAVAARTVRELGVSGALAEARRQAEPWVADELALAWPRYGEALADTLEATAASSGPTLAELARIGQAGVPVGLVAFVDDPLHPVSVAERWQASLPRSVLYRLALADCARDRAVLGDSAVAAWQAARMSPGRTTQPNTGYRVTRVRDS